MRPSINSSRSWSTSWDASATARGDQRTATKWLTNMNEHPTPSPLTRRRVLTSLAGLGLGSAAFQRAVAWQAEQAGKITPELIQQAEWIAGITLTDEERKAIATTVERDQRRFEALRKVELSNSIPPALAFFAAPPQEAGAEIRRGDVRPIESAAPQRPLADED